MDKRGERRREGDVSIGRMRRRRGEEEAEGCECTHSLTKLSCADGVCFGEFGVPPLLVNIALIGLACCAGDGYFLSLNDIVEGGRERRT